MTTREHINEYFNGRPFMILCAIALMVVAAVALSMGVRPAPVESTGIFFSFGQVLIEAGPLSAAVNVLGLLATGGIMLALNKVFSYVRSVTHLFVSVFFLLQLAFNFLWSFLFFSFQAFGLAFLWLAVLWVLIVRMVLSFYDLDRPAAWLQLPYLLWVLFAAYLNLGVWKLN